jgi:hypothetical protein
MNRVSRVALLAALAGELILPTATAASRTVAAELAQCTAISAADARLACYDTLAGRTPDRPVPSVAGVGAMAVPAPMPAPAVAPPAATATASAPTRVPTSIPSATVTPPPPTEQPQNFGLSGAQQYTPAQKAAVIQSIQAHVAQVAADQLRTTYVVLDNGQTWKSTDGDMNLNQGEAVTIKRAALGSFLLTSANNSYHVRRIR